MVAPAGNAKLTPPVKCHVFCGFAGSYSGRFASVRFRNSMYWYPLAGSYMTSLMMTGPTSGAALAAPGVGTDMVVKSASPSLFS